MLLEKFGTLTGTASLPVNLLSPDAVSISAINNKCKKCNLGLLRLSLSIISLSIKEEEKVLYCTLQIYTMPFNKLAFNGSNAK